MPLLFIFIFIFIFIFVRIILLILVCNIGNLHHSGALRRVDVSPLDSPQSGAKRVTGMHKCHRQQEMHTCHRQQELHFMENREQNTMRVENGSWLSGRAEGVGHVTEEEDEGRRATGATPGLVREIGRNRSASLLGAAGVDGDDATGSRDAAGDGANNA
jgi:hypothetical protein